MTIGIYCLRFKATDKVYIGQSVNIEKRYKEHLRLLASGNGKKKLQDAYNNYGKPELDILAVTLNSEELNKLELDAINIFDSVNNGFNTLDYTGNPNMRGLDSVHSKLDRETYVYIYKDLANTDLTISCIASRYSTTTDIVGRIFRGETHVWLEKEYPDEYIILKQKRTIGRYKTNLASQKDRMLISSSGTIYYVTNIREFCREHNLNPAHVSRVLNGIRKSHKGWKKFEDEKPASELASLQHLRELGVKV